MLKFLIFFLIFTTFYLPQLFSQSNTSSNTNNSTPKPIGTQVPIEAKSQPWEKRRAKFQRLVESVNKNDPKAIQSLDKLLTKFDNTPFSWTPLEIMEILGACYIGRNNSSPEQELILVSSAAVLGLYDTLRFASKSGQAEIISNEKLFQKAFLIAGEDSMKKITKFLEEEPEKAAKSVDLGISLADKVKNGKTYNHSWPTSYGLERILKTMDNSNKQTVAAMPQAEWDKAWEEAKQKVTYYYRINH